MEKQKRNVNLHFRVTPEEKNKISEIMEEYKIKDFGRYARRMLIGGHILIIDWQELYEITRQVTGIATNINQIAYRANATRHVYQSDLEQIQKQLSEIIRLLNLFKDTFMKLDCQLEQISN